MSSRAGTAIPVPRRRGVVRIAIGLGGAALALCVLAWFVVGGNSLLANGRGWTFSSNEDGIQALYSRGASAANPVLFRMACNTEDGVVWMNSQALASDDVEKLARTRHRLDMTLVGAGRTLAIEGYVTRAPEGASISYEIPRTSELLAIVAADDFAATGPSLSLHAAGTKALGEFARACPPATAPATWDKYGWGTTTSPVNGYRLDIPRRLLRITWGDRFGRAYESDTGNASLLVMSQVNALEQSLADALRAGQGGPPVLDTETYRHATSDSIVLSGLSRGAVVYFKVRTTCGNANIVSFTLTYDASARETFDHVAARMSKSFDAKTLPDGRPLCP